MDNPLDGCQYVYLDMGTNIGVQIRFLISTVSGFGEIALNYFRKLFEPQHYEEAKILPVFEKYFGPFNQRDKSQVGDNNKDNSRAGSVTKQCCFRFVQLAGNQILHTLKDFRICQMHTTNVDSEPLFTQKLELMSETQRLRLKSNFI